MNNEFRNMDQLIQDNQLNTDRAMKPLHLPEKSSSWWRAMTLSTAAMVAILVVYNTKITSQSESLLALNESMSWDATSGDEWPDEMTDTIAYLDL